MCYKLDSCNMMQVYNFSLNFQDLTFQEQTESIPNAKMP